MTTLRRIVLPLLAVALMVSGVWLFVNASGRRGAVQAGEDAARAAKDSVVAMFSYQPATAEQTLESAARDRLTGAFLDEYTQLVKTVVVPEAVGKRITAAAEVPAVAVISADRNHAVLLAYVDQTLTAGSAAPTRTNSAARVTMDKLDGRWLISGFEPI